MNEKILPYCWNIKPTSAYERLYIFSFLQGNVDKNAYAFIPIIEKNNPIKLLTSNGIFTVKPTKNHKEWTLSVTLECSEQLTEHFKSDGLTIRSTGDNIAVITLPNFMDDKMPEDFYNNLPKLKGYKGFIIDIRDNGGGNSDNADAFSQAFIEGEFQTGKVKHAIHMGAYEAWGGGRGYLLINFDSIGRATIIGVPSYGSTGNPLFIELPGNGLARICTRRYTYPNDKEFINIGIQPHIYKELAFEDLLNGRDSILDTGLKVLRNQL